MATNQLDRLQLGVNFNDVLKANKQLDRLHDNVVRIARASERLRSVNKAYENQARSVKSVSTEVVNMTNFVKANATENEKVTSERKRQIDELRRKQKEQFTELRKQYRDEQRLAKQTADAEIKERLRASREAEKLAKQKAAAETKAQRQAVQAAEKAEQQKARATLRRLKVEDRERKKLQRERERARRKELEDIRQSDQLILASVAATVAATGVIVARRTFQAVELFEQARVNLDTLTGSAVEGARVFQQLQELTVETPFTLEDTLVGAKRLLAFGIETDQVTESLRRLGDIAAGVGRERLPQLILAYGQVRTATRLTGQELRQFQEAGVPLLDLLANRSEKTAQEIKEAMADGVAPSFRDVQQAIKDATDEGGKFFELMQKQSQTLAGEIAKLDDAFTIFLASFGNKYAGILKNIVSNVRTGLTQLGRLFDDDLEEIQERIGELQSAIRRSSGDVVLQKTFLTELAGIYPEILKNVKLTELSQEEQARILKEQGANVKSVSLELVSTEERARLIEERFAAINKAVNTDNLRKQLRELNDDISEQLEVVVNDRREVLKTFTELEAGDLRTTKTLVESARGIAGAFSSFSPVQDLEKSLQALENLRAKAAELLKLLGEAPRVETETTIEPAPFATPKVLEAIAKSFRQIDSEASLGLRSFRSVYDEKAKIVSNFVEKSGVEAQALQQIFAGTLPSGQKLKASDAKVLSRGLQDSLKTDFQEADDATQFSDREEEIVKILEDGFDNRLKARQEYISQLSSIQATEIITEQEFIQMQLKALDRLERSKIGVTAASINKRRALEEQLATANVNTWSRNLQTFGSIFGNIASIVGDESREAFEQSKNLARASAVVYTASGVMNALANNPDPVSKWIDVAAVLSTGASQLATINSQEFESKGGIDTSAFGQAASVQSSFGADPGSNADITDRLRAISDATLADDDATSFAGIDNSLVRANRTLDNILNELRTR